MIVTRPVKARSPHFSAALALLWMLACSDSGPTDSSNDEDVFRPTSDVSLSGTQAFRRVVIPAGVTVTATGPLVFMIEEDAVVEGRILGACGPIELRSASSLRVTGRIDNTCTDQAGADAPGLKLIAAHSFELVGAILASSGPVTLGSEVLGAQAARGLAPAQDAGCTAVNASVELQPRVAAAPVAGAPGRTGAGVTFTCPGPLELAGVTIAAQSGSSAGAVEVAMEGEARATGLLGGMGGSVVVSANGEMVASGGVILRAGDGGRGGDATATGLPGPTGAGAAQATGGEGGQPGHAVLRSSAALRVSFPVQMEIGRGGDGGTATAIGADGLPGDGSPPQPGGAAHAIGGNGGSVPDRPSIEVATVEGLERIVVRGGNAGHGGEAIARAGQGGNGGGEFPNGAVGGDLEARGGTGGTAAGRDARGQNVGQGGNGGRATFEGGNGGAGASACLIPGIDDPGSATAGNGGSGGDASGGGGVGGIGAGAQRGIDGAVVVRNAGNGGAGGSGDPPGAGGSPGTDEIEGAGARQVIAPAFATGPSGQPCPEILANLTISARIAVAPDGDPANHDPLIFDTGPIGTPEPGGGFTGGKPIALRVVLFADGTALIAGPPPWVRVEGTLLGDGTLLLSGTGSVKEIPGSTAEFQGIIVGDVILGTYVMTPRGQPPITYQIFPGGF